MKIYKDIIKPASDFIFALIVIILISPVFIILTILLFIYNSGSPFFFQFRPGIQGRIFRLIKFKTMNEKKDMNGTLLPAAQRITPIGRFIRQTSLDEVPQLINIINGDMSFIGPRPLLIDYLPLYDKMQNRRHEVKPGITGLAQVKGRNIIDWDEKFKHDVWYVDHVSFFLDMKILWLTIVKVLKREGIDFKGSTMDSSIEAPFKGNLK